MSFAVTDTLSKLHCKPEWMPHLFPFLHWRTQKYLLTISFYFDRSDHTSNIIGEPSFELDWSMSWWTLYHF